MVGVVGNIRHEGLSQDIEAEIYTPYLQENEFFMHLAVRTAVEPASMASAIRAQVAAIDPDQPIYNVATLEQAISDSVAPGASTYCCLEFSLSLRWPSPRWGFTE